MTVQRSMPEFAVALRGYDRHQVDTYVGRLAVWMDEFSSRLEGAEARARVAGGPPT